MEKLVPIEVGKIDDSTYWIEDNGTRCFLFIGEIQALLVDTGKGKSGSLKAIVDSLTDKPVMLVNSHADWDHVGNNEEFGLAYMHPAEMSNYAVSKPGAPSAPLWEGEVIDIGGRAFEVILIPGHTPGSIALLDRANRVILTGDSASGTRPMFLFGEKRSVDAYILSIEKLLGLRDSFDTLYSAHGLFPLPPETLEKQLAAAQKLRAGELPPPKDPPRPDIPAKVYEYDGAAFIF